MSLRRKPIVRAIASWLGAHDLKLVIAVALAATGLWLFVLVAEEMREGDSHDIDRSILLALREAHEPGDPLGPTWFEEMARDITALGGDVVLLGATLAVLGYLLLRRAFLQAIVVVVATAGAELGSMLLKLAFGRPRPDLVPALAEVYTLSFPSGHAMVSAAVYLTFATQLSSLHHDIVVRGYLITCTLIIVALIGASRVYLGVHYPTDVLAGWALGAAWALLVWAGARYYTRRRR